MLKHNRIAVLCQYPFPEGMAATIRILTYCKGLQANGVDTEVFSFRWLADNDPAPSCGEVIGVKYKTSHRWDTGKGRIHKILVDKTLIYFKAVRDIVRSHRENPLDYVILSFDSIANLAFFVPALRLCGIKLVFICDEFPQAIRNLKHDIPFFHKIAYRILSLGIEKRITMTGELERFYNQFGVRPTHQMCSVLDTDRFDGVRRQAVEKPYLCYMGNMQLAKDNVDNIIEAFALLADRYPELELHLYGTPGASDKALLQSVIDRHGLEARVLLKGRAGYESVPQILANATLLVTSQPDTRRAEGGFPTKMAEYMMSHTPMLVTDVGEICRYVKDGETAFVVAPADPVAYSERVADILDDPESAKCIAENAYEYASANFGAVSVTSALVSFLDDDSENR